MMNDFAQDSRGVTLVELIVAIGIFSLVISGVVAVFLVSSKSKDIVFEQLEVQGQARRVVQDFVNEARVMHYSSAGAYPLQVRKLFSTLILILIRRWNDCVIFMLRVRLKKEWFSRQVARLAM